MTALPAWCQETGLPLEATARRAPSWGWSETLAWLVWSQLAVVLMGFVALPCLAVASLWLPGQARSRVWRNFWRGWAIGALAALALAFLSALVWGWERPALAALSGACAAAVGGWWWARRPRSAASGGDGGRRARPTS